MQRRCLVPDPKRKLVWCPPNSRIPRILRHVGARHAVPPSSNFRYLRCSHLRKKKVAFAIPVYYIVYKPLESGESGESGGIWGHFT